MVAENGDLKVENEQLIQSLKTMTSKYDNLSKQADEEIGKITVFIDQYREKCKRKQSEMQQSLNTQLEINKRLVSKQK